MICALDVGFAAVTGRCFTNGERSVIFGAVEAERSRRATATNFLAVGGLLAVATGASMFVYGAVIANAAVGVWAAMWATGSMSIVALVGAVVVVLLPPARQRQRLVQTYFKSIEDRTNETMTVFVQGFAAGPDAPLLSLFRGFNRVADEHRVGVLAVAGNRKRLGVYTGRAGNFRVLFTDPEPTSGTGPRRWYLARYPTEIAD